jgi:hypothetical protein
MTGSSSGAAKPAISQRDLSDFLALKGQLEALKRRFALERERLLLLVEGHTPVEPGRLHAEVRESAYPRVTKAFLVGVLGEDGYEEMRAEAPPTVYRRLVVGERARETNAIVGQGANTHGWTAFVKKELP